jgi:nucleoside-diphosphate-sugar epimerase
MKVVILGSTGFAGKNIAECLSDTLTVIKASRSFNNSTNENEIYFDLFNKESWGNIINVSPDVIINAAAYGVIKNETDNDIMYQTNYFYTSNLFDYVSAQKGKPFWIQLGTAFEYDLSVNAITEQSPCLPRTHYGISKLMMSNYLLNKGGSKAFSIMRPFGMFGRYEDDSKFFPYLINAQKINTPVNLSPGTQKRDYIYVKDLGRFINTLITGNKLKELPGVINIGRSEAISFLGYASALESVLPGFEPGLWKWGQINFRADESLSFYSASQIAAGMGFTNTPLPEAFRETASYYLSFKHHKI